MSTSPNREAPKKPVAWGVLSTARINRLVLAGAAEASQVRMLGVASRELAAAEAFAREHGLARAYGSYEELLADPEIEAVYIPLPNAMHVDWSIRALQAGKHVLCEKPLSDTESGARAAFEVADQAGRLLSEAFMYRHHPQTERLVALIGDGEVGRVRVVRAAFSFPLAREGDVRLSSALAGGGLMDVGCYCVNAARLVGGEPERVYGERALGGDGVDVAFSGVLRLADEVLAHFDCGLALAGRDELEVVGERGSLFLDDPWHCREPVIELRTADGTRCIEVERADPYGRELEDFSAAIREGRQPRLGRQDAIGQARTIEALLTSAREGRAVQPGAG